MHRRARPRRGPRVRRVRPLSLWRPERRQPQVPRAPRVYVALVAAVPSVPGCIAIRRCRRDRRFPLVPKCSSGRSRCLVPRPPAVPSFRRCERRPRMASHRLLLVQPARDRRAVRSGPRSSVSSVRSRRRPACLAFLVNVACLALLVYIAYVESIALAASRPGQRPALGGPPVRGGGHRIRSRQRTVFLGSVPRAELPPPRRGTSRVAPLACLAFLVNVACLALLVYIAYVESIALAASRPGQRPALGGPSCGGEGTRYARGSPCVRSSLAPFPGAPGYVESRSPGLPRVPRERRVPRAARFAYVEKTPRRWPRARPAAWAGRTIARGSAVHTRPVRTVFLAPFPQG